MNECWDVNPNVRKTTSSIKQVSYERALLITDNTELPKFALPVDYLRKFAMGDNTCNF